MAPSRRPGYPAAAAPTQAEQKQTLRASVVLHHLLPAAVWGRCCLPLPSFFRDDNADKKQVQETRRDDCWKQSSDWPRCSRLTLRKSRSPVADPPSCLPIPTRVHEGARARDMSA